MLTIPGINNNAVVHQVDPGDIHVTGDIDQTSLVFLESTGGNITIDGKIDGSSSVILKAAGNIVIGTNGNVEDMKIDGNSHVQATAGGSISLGSYIHKATVDFAAHGNISVPGDINYGATVRQLADATINLGGNIDGASRVEFVSNRASIIIGGKVDGGSRVWLTGSGGVLIGQTGPDMKIDGDSFVSATSATVIHLGGAIGGGNTVVDFAACAGISIGQGISGGATVRLLASMKSLTVADAIDGGNTHVTAWPPGALVPNLTGGATFSESEWTATEPLCQPPPQNGSWWENWSQTFGYIVPARIVPRSLDDLVAAVAGSPNADGADTTPVKAVGGGWSFTDAVLPLTDPADVTSISIMAKGRAGQQDLQDVLNGLSSSAGVPIDLLPSAVTRNVGFSTKYDQSTLRQVAAGGVQLPSSTKARVIDTRSLASSLQSEFSSIRSTTSALTSAPPAHGDPVGYARSAGVDAVVYCANDNHIYELSLITGGTWKANDLCALAGAPPTAGDPAAYVRSDGVDAVVYRASNGHIYELSLPAGGTWKANDLSQLAGALAAAGDPAGYTRSDSVNAVVFRASDGNIWELSLPATGGWKVNNLCALAGAPVAAGDPVGYVRSDKVNAVLYRASDAHIHELSLPAASPWRHNDLCALATAPAAAGDPDAYVRSDSVNAVLYRASDAHIHELSLPTGGTWHGNDLCALANAPAAAGDPGAYVRSVKVNAVLYRAADGDIHELSLAAGASWKNNDLCALAGAPPAAGDPCAYVRADSVNAVVYRATDTGVYELSLATGGTWKSNRLSENEILFHVEAGITIADLQQLLDHQFPRLALRASGGSPGATLAGTMSTATHGGEFMWPLLVDTVRAIHLVGPGGEQWWIEGDVPVADQAKLQLRYPEIDAAHFIGGSWNGIAGLTAQDVLDAVSVSVGTMGVIYSVVLAVVEQFGLRQIIHPTTWSALLSVAGVTEVQLRTGDAAANTSLLNALMDGTINGTGIAKAANVYIDLAMNPINTDCWIVNRQLTPSLPDDANTPSASLGDYQTALGLTLAKEDNFQGDKLSARLMDCFRYETDLPGFTGQIFGGRLQALFSYITRLPDPLVGALAITGVQVVANIVNDPGDPERGMMFVGDMLSGFFHALEGTLPGLNADSTAVGYKVGAIGWPDTGLPGRGLEIALDSTNAFTFLQTVLLDGVLTSVMQNGNKPLIGYISVRVCPPTKTLLGMQQYSPQSVMIEIVAYRSPEGNAVMDAIAQSALAFAGPGPKPMFHWGLENDFVNAQVLLKSPLGQKYKTFDSKLDAFVAIRRFLRNGQPAVFDNAFSARMGL